MKNRTNSDVIGHIVIAFFINLISFNLARIYFELSFLDSLIYSGINAIWMGFVLVPLGEKILLYFDEKEEKELQRKRIKIIEDFERQKEKIKEPVNK